MRVDAAWLKDYQAKRKSVPQKEQKEVTEDPQYRSKWEADYAHMLEIRKGLNIGHPEKILDWHHEPVKLKLYTKVTIKRGIKTRRSIYYVPDFMIEHIDGSIEMVEVKGYERKAGELKYFQAVNKYVNFIWRKVTKENGVWTDMHYKQVHKLGFNEVI